MRDLVKAARQLRTVREAQRRFLTLWAMDCLQAQTRALGELASQIPQASQPGLADPFNHDWSLLYRGSVLDD